MTLHSHFYLLLLTSHSSIQKPTHLARLVRQFQKAPKRTMHFQPLLLTLSTLPALILASPSPVHAYGFRPSPTGPNPIPTSTLAPPYCPPRRATPKQQRAIFSDFVDTLYIQKNVPKAFNDHVASNLIEHDPFDFQGRDPNIAKLSAIIPFAKFAVQRHNFDNEIGFIHLRVDENPGPVALADVYRFNGTCIVEHWDIAQVYPANATNHEVGFF